MQDRYFVDERGGCIAVRDINHTDPAYSGLHSDTEGVVRFWSGMRTTSGNWAVPDEFKEAAYRLCSVLNKATLLYFI